MSKKKTIAEMAEEHLQALENRWLDDMRREVREAHGDDGMKRWPSTMLDAENSVAKARAERAQERIERDVTRETRMRDALACVLEWMKCQCSGGDEYGERSDCPYPGWPEADEHEAHVKKTCEEALK